MMYIPKHAATNGVISVVMLLPTEDTPLPTKVVILVISHCIGAASAILFPFLLIKFRGRETVIYSNIFLYTHLRIRDP